MRKRGLILFYSCLCVLLFVFGMRFLTNLTDPEYGYGRYREFIKDSERCEVLFFGNSHMGAAVYPMELWHDQGIVSYNMAGSGNPMPVTSWMLKNILRDASPKVVVIDCYRLRYDKKIDTKERLHVQADPLPLTTDKVRMICDLLEEPKDRLEFIWSFAAYHERWQELDQADFEKSDSAGKGGSANYGAVPPGEMAKRPTEAVGFTSVGTEYLRGMIEECQSRDIEVLLVYLPFPAFKEDWQEAFCMEQIAEEYGVSSINFLDLQVVDFASDCYDENSHLNGSGGRKVTKYLGQYLVDHYDVEDHRGEAEYADWEEDFGQYTESKKKTLEQMESLDKTLVMLADQSMDCCIYVNGDADIWQQNEMYLPLIENIADWDTEKLAQASAQGRDYLLIVDHQGGGVFESVDGENLPKECSLGTIFYEADENGERRLRVKDRLGRTMPESQPADDWAVQIFMRSNQGDGTVCTKSFDVDETIKLAR